MQFVGRHARMLRQLPDGREVVGEELCDAVDEVVRHPRPHAAGRLGADVMRHAGGARREDRQVAAALPLELELRLHALAQLRRR